MRFAATTTTASRAARASVLVLGGGLAGCASLAQPPCPVGTTAATAAEAFFGRSVAGSPRVTDADWEAFLAEEATPRFPDGLTVSDARGQWRGPSGAAEREASKRLTVLLPGADLATARGRMEPLAAAYAARFGQQAVLTAYAPACAAFVPPG